MNHKYRNHNTQRSVQAPQHPYEPQVQEPQHKKVRTGSIASLWTASKGTTLQKEPQNAYVPQVQNHYTQQLVQETQNANEPQVQEPHSGEYMKSQVHYRLS